MVYTRICHDFFKWVSETHDQFTKSQHICAYNGITICCARTQPKYLVTFLLFFGPTKLKHHEGFL